MKINTNQRWISNWKKKKSKDHSINQKFETILAYTENGSMQVDHNKMVCHSCKAKDEIY